MPQAALRHEPVGRAVAPVVLVVEDDALIRLCVADHLREIGYSVIEASNGDEALAVFASGLPIAVAFSDVQMPGATDGVQLALQLRQRHPETRVMLTSACLPEGTAREALDGVPFIPKPYRPEEIAECIGAELKKGGADGTEGENPAAALVVPMRVVSHRVRR
jgi:two-component system, response regulator PdtaR